MDVKSKYRQYQSIDGWRMGTISDAMRDWCAAYASRTCVITQEGEITYAQMWQQIESAASVLYGMGLRKGDRVILQLPNGLDFLSVFFATIKIGAIPIMGLPAHRIGEIRGMIDTAAPAAYICRQSYMGFDYTQIADTLTAENLVPHVLVIRDGETLPGMASDPVIVPPSGADNVDTAFLSLSGGTTGMSKLIPRTHGDYLYDTEVSARRCALTGDDVVLVLLPLPHNYIIGHPGFLGTFSRGATLLLSEFPDMNEGLELIESRRATFLSVVPSMARLMLELLSEEDYDISSLRVVQVGGAFFDEATADAMMALGSFTLQQVFGTAEGLNTMTRLDDPPEVIRSCQGRPTSPYDVIRIADEENCPLPPGEYGELQIRGPYTIHAYYNYPDNDKCFTPDDYYKTGDRAVILPGGNLKLAGRITEMINRGGEKIVPSEIESALAEYPGIRDCAVVGLPDENLGEKIAVFVVSDEEADPAMLRRFLADRELAAYKMPDAVFRLDALPLTKIGKTDKKKLKEIGKEMDQHE